MMVDPLRVVHLVPAAFGDDGVVGGAERYAYELARHMADEVPTKLVTFGPRDRRETRGGLELQVLGGAWLVREQQTNPFSLRLFSALADGKVIHCHQQHVLASSAAAAYARATGRRVFVTDLGGGGWDVSTYWSTDRWFHGHLHISEYSRRVFGHEAFARARVILGGVDHMRFSPDPVTPKENLVLFVGRVLPHKGINYLIEALPDGLTLEVIGRQTDARYFGDLQRLASGKSVSFVPHADDAVLIHAYRRAKCVVLPSVYRTIYGDQTLVPELLGQTLLEGMACGLPAICTDVASMPEVVTNEVTGFIVPPNDPGALREKLVWLRDHPEKVETMGAAARKRVLQDFTWAAVVQRCFEAYRS